MNAAARMRNLLRVERALDAPFASAWRDSRERVLGEVPSGWERRDWQVALDWARPFYAVAYAGGELPVCVYAVTDLIACLDDSTGARDRPPDAPPNPGKALTKRQREIQRNAGVTGKFVSLD